MLNGLKFRTGESWLTCESFQNFHRFFFPHSWWGGREERAKSFTSHGSSINMMALQRPNVFCNKQMCLGKLHLGKELSYTCTNNETGSPGWLCSIFLLYVHFVILTCNFSFCNDCKKEKFGQKSTFSICIEACKQTLANVHVKLSESRLKVSLA